MKKKKGNGLVIVIIIVIVIGLAAGGYFMFMKKGYKVEASDGFTGEQISAKMEEIKKTPKLMEIVNASVLKKNTSELVELKKAAIWQLKHKK